MNKQVCTFSVGDTLFGVDVPSIQEVLRAQPMTRVPLAPAVVAGLINLRGQILTAIDLRERLGLPRASGDSERMNLVVRLPDETVSFLVDDVGEVLNVTDDQFEEAPLTLRGAVKEVTSGIYKLKDGLLLLMNITAAATLPTK